MHSAFLKISLFIILINSLKYITGQKVREKSPFNITLISSPKDTVVIQSQELHLNCSTIVYDSDGNTFYVQWLKDGKNLIGQNFISEGEHSFLESSTNADQHSKRCYMLQNNSLVIKNFDVSDQGEYSCIINSTKGAFMSSPAKVQMAVLNLRMINGNSSVYIKGDNIPRTTAFLNQNLLLKCNVDALPAPYVEWWKDDKRLNVSDSWRLIQPNWMHLHFLQVVNDDAGLYKCKLSNIVGTFKTMTHVDVYYEDRINKNKVEPKLLSSSDEVEASAGDDVVLECLWSFSHSIWYRHGQLLNGSSNPTSLYIKNVSIDADGEYMCINANNTSINSSIILHVYDTPVLLNAQVQYVDFLLKESFSISCSCATRSHINITWFKNANQLKPHEVSHVTENIDADQGIHTSTLTWNEMEVHNKGVYQCVIYNMAVVLTSSFFVFKAGPHAPTNLRTKTVEDGILLKWDDEMNDDINYYVVYYGLTEYFPYQFISDPQVGNKREATMIGLESYKSYSFYVIAISKSSEVSDVSETVTGISPENVPICAPQTILEKRNSTAILIKWSLLLTRQARGIITKHKIFFRVYNINYNKDAKEKYFEVPGNKTSFMIAGLDHNESFQARVLTGTNAGYPSLPDSQWAWTTIHMTSNIVIIKDVEVILLKGPGARIQWKLRLASKKVEIFGHDVKFRKVGEVVSRSVWSQNSYRSALLRNLEPHSNYTLTISVSGEGLDCEPAVANFSTGASDEGRDPNDDEADKIFDNKDVDEFYEDEVVPDVEIVVVDINKKKQEEDKDEHDNENANDYVYDVNVNMSAQMINETTIHVMWSPESNLVTSQLCYVPAMLYQVDFLNTCTKCIDGSSLANTSELYLNDLSPMILYQIYWSMQNEDYVHDDGYDNIAYNDENIVYDEVDDVTNLTCATEPLPPELSSCDIIQSTHSINVTWNLALHQPCHPLIINHTHHHFILSYSIMGGWMRLDGYNKSVVGGDGTDNSNNDDGIDGSDEGDSESLNWSSIVVNGSKRNYSIKFGTDKVYNEDLSRIDDSMDDNSDSTTNLDNVKAHKITVKVCVVFFDMIRCSQVCQTHTEINSLTPAQLDLKFTVIITTIIAIICIVAALFGLVCFIYTRKRSQSNNKKLMRENRMMFKSTSNGRYVLPHGRKKGEVIPSGKPLLMLDDQRVSLQPTKHRTSLRTFKPKESNL